MCLECDDVAKTVEDIRAKGAPIDIEPKEGGDGNTQAWTRDPDGNKIELMYIHPQSRQALA
jgi:lactoylglutathione lyase